MQEILEKRRVLMAQLEQLNHSIDKDILSPLIKKRDEFVAKMDPLKEQLAELKQEVDQVEAEIQKILNTSDMDEYDDGNNRFFFDNELSFKTVDIDKLYNWMKENDKFDILRADIIKKTETSKLVDKGIMPDGIDVRTYKKFKVKTSKR